MKIIVLHSVITSLQMLGIAYMRSSVIFIEVVIRLFHFRLGPCCLFTIRANSEKVLTIKYINGK